jgi:hypothetical protein
VISEMHWPGIRAKVWPVKLIRLSRWDWRPKKYFPNDYYGFWLALTFGHWIVVLGTGQYKDRQP